ncbi:MAG: bifunctional helix-turn-helix transcriptional regulator/GNAT family N-acetyltransferase [Marmoricola sp.]
MAETDTAVLRRFNRSYTQRIGALDESFLGMGLPLGAARLLFEIGHGPTTTRELRGRLGLDSGYLSRLLRRLEDRGLVEVVPDPADRRRRTVRVTRQGRAAWRRLDRRSEDLAQQLVAPLTERQRTRLAQALATADLLVRSATVSLDVVNPALPAARTAVAAYVGELADRFPGGFEPDDPTADEAAMRPPGGVFLLALSDGRPVACGGLRTIADGLAEVKRMWVDGAWRGAGLGARLLRALEDEARRLGCGLVRLDTNATLTEAIAMYERAGYRSVPRYNDNPYAEAWFEKELRAPAVGQGSCRT